MMKEKKWNVYVFGILILALTLLYTLFKVKCFGSCNAPVIKPLFAELLGLVPTVLLLFCFSGKIFFSWMKHISWWFLLMTTYFVYQTEPYGGILSIDRAQVALFWMAALFIVTLIYALVMSRKLKDS
jgi:hypothetical protein